jgi:hypothetical protein
MSAYTKQFLIDAFMSRYIACNLITIEQLEHLETITVALYDKVGRDKFRVYAALDADAIRVYKATLK